MKTDRFENTIRRKLESIAPEFQEGDWNKMQNYMHIHSAPAFWKQYGGWVGYAAAASVTAITTFLYFSQVQKTSALESDMQSLKSRMETIAQNTSMSKSDTIYLVQKEMLNEPHLVGYNLAPPFEAISDQKLAAGSENFSSSESPAIGSEAIATLTAPGNKLGLHIEAQQVPGNSYHSEDIAKIEPISKAGSGELSTLSTTETPALKMTSVAMIEPKTFRPSAALSYDMEYTLMKRISPEAINTLFATPDYTISKAELAIAQPSKIADSKTAGPEKIENVVPRLPIKTPYRFGAGIQFEGQNQAKTIIGELLTRKRFSFSTGISWLKVKPMEFFNEKIFVDKNKRDFKRSHPDEVPMALDIQNINVKPTLVQIPLTAAFRSNIGKDLDYYVSVGTYLTVSSKEQYSYDCLVSGSGPVAGYLRKSFEKRVDHALINAMNVSVGIEKIWYPIVIQAEGYAYAYFIPLSPFSQQMGPGLKLKLLYQIGKKI